MRDPRPGLAWSRGRVQHRAAYQRWMASDAWHARRLTWADTYHQQHGHPPVCAICGRTWTPNSGDLHHRSYRRLGHETDTDLVPLCRTPCHDQVHRIIESNPAWQHAGREHATDIVIARLHATAHRQEPPPPMTDHASEPAQPRDPIEELRELIGVPPDSEFPDIPSPTHWAAIAAGDAPDAWRELRAWVDRLADRFDLDHHVLPGCWWRHNRHVEALAALRDHERASYSDTAPATAPVDWIRAVRDVTALLAVWTSDTGCATGHHPQPSPLRAVDEAAWDAHVAADAHRRASRTGTAAGGDG